MLILLVHQNIFAWHHFLKDVRLYKHISCDTSKHAQSPEKINLKEDICANMCICFLCEAQQPELHFGKHKICYGDFKHCIVFKWKTSWVKVCQKLLRLGGKWDLHWAQGTIAKTLLPAICCFVCNSGSQSKRGITSENYFK